MQKDINRWERGINATRGYIRPDKSFVYPRSFKWDNHGDYSLENPEDHDMGLTVKKDFCEGEELKQVHPSKVYNTIGVFIAPDGSLTDQ